MQPEQRDQAYLWDMIDGCRGVVELVKGMEFAAYAGDRRTQLAVERQIEIIGEAARRVSDGLKEAHPEIPWRKIIAQRHILAHEYGQVQQDRIWRVAVIHIPELIRQLEPLLPGPQPE